MPNEKHINDSHEKYFAIGVNATNDINPCQKLELKDKNGKIICLDSFELFFKNSEKARSIYASIFNDVKKQLNTSDTKLPIFSHTTNVSDIRSGSTQDFIINIVLKEGEEALSYNLGKLSNREEVSEKLEKKGHGYSGINLGSYGLDGILNGDDNEGYINLFNYGIGGGTHNIASTISSFSEIIKSKWFKIIAPNYIDKTNKYTSRTSLFFQDEDGKKYCIRTDALESQLNIVQEIIDFNKNNISDILVTDKKTLHSKSVKKHSVPTVFSENVLHDVLTVVFNCEDREMGEVINAVIREIKNILKRNNIEFEKKTYLSNYLKNLKSLKKELHSCNKLIKIKDKGLKYKYDYISYIEKLNEPIELNKEKSKLPGLINEIKDLSNRRLNILKEILFLLVDVTKLTENKKHKINLESLLGRLVLITDGSDGSVGSLEAYNHEIFFTNTIWNIGDYEKKLFRVLKRYSGGLIDIDVCDTTGCGDNSTASAVMTREDTGIDIRRQAYTEALTQMGVPEKSFNRALAIIESYFLSHFQEVLSGVVYHCKKSSLGKEIPNNEKINGIILSYVFKDTIKFIESGLSSFIYSNDNSNITEGRLYNGFNVYKINEL